jgi:hypothetical protein
LRIDATYFKRFCALCYQDHEDGYTQLVRFSDGEHFEEIREDLTNLIRLGVHIESITTDGHKSILKAIKKSLPDAIVQRCLVHIQRMCLLWLTRFPKHLAGIELRQLVLQIMAIKTQNDCLYWITRKNVQSIHRALLAYAQAFKALIPDHQKGIAQYVPLPNEPQNTSHNQWH